MRVRDIHCTVPRPVSRGGSRGSVETESISPNGRATPTAVLLGQRTYGANPLLVVIYIHISFFLT